MALFLKIWSVLLSSFFPNQTRIFGIWFSHHNYWSVKSKSTLLRPVFGSMLNQNTLHQINFALLFILSALFDFCILSKLAFEFWSNDSLIQKVLLLFLSFCLCHIRHFHQTTAAAAAAVAVSTAFYFSKPNIQTGKCYKIAGKIQEINKEITAKSTINLVFIYISSFCKLYQLILISSKLDSNQNQKFQE